MNRTPRPNVRRAFAGIAAILIANPFPCPTLSAEEVEMNDLFSVVSSLKAKTPTMSWLPVGKTPGTVTVITQKEIQELGATTLDEVLAFMPGVDAVYSPMGFAGNIRGFGGSPFQEGVQFLIDGVPYNSPDKGGSSASPGYNSFPVPIEMIKQLEVIREPISALYGPNAFFGVINVITKTGQDFGGKGSVAARAGNKGSGRGLQRYAASYGRSDGPWDWSLAGDFGRELGPMKFNRETRLEDSKAAGKIRYNNLLISWLNQVGSAEPFVFDGVKTIKSQQNINMGTVDYSKQVTDDLSITAKSSYLSRRGTNCQACHNPLFQKTTAPDDHREAFYRLMQQAHATYEGLAGNRVTVGGEFLYDKEHMDSGIMGDARPVSRTYSGFVQDLVTIREDLTATLGVRRDHSDWSKDKALTDPRVLLVYTPDERVTYRAGFTQAHRVPTYHDLHAFFPFVPVTPPPTEFFLMGNPNLKPESIQTYNLGTDRWLSDGVLLKVNGFYSFLRHQIDRRLVIPPEMAALFPSGQLPNGAAIGPATFGMQWTNNPANAVVAGGEVELNLKPSRFLETRLNYGYKNVSFNKDLSAFMGGSHAPNAPHHIASAVVTVHPTSRLMLTATERYRGSFYPGFATQATSLPGVFDGRERVSGALLTDFHVRYAFRSGVSLSLLGRNIFNQRPLQWRLPEDTELDTGRDFFLQAAYDFGGKGR